MENKEWCEWRTKARWRESILLGAADVLATGLLSLNPIAWLGLYCHRRWQKPPPMSLVDSWLLLELVGSLLCLHFAKARTTLLVWPVLVAAYFLTDQVAILLRDVLVSPHIHGVLTVRHPQRWLLGVIVTLATMILSFAAIYRTLGDQFDPAIRSAHEATYFSLVSTTTVGYGDFKPICSRSQTVAMCQLTFVILLLTLKLPIALSMIKTDVFSPETWAEHDRASPAKDQHAAPKDGSM